MVWSAIAKEVDELSETQKHKNLPGIDIPMGILFTRKIGVVCLEKDILLFTVPSVFAKSAAKLVNQYIKLGQIIVDVVKGIETDTLYTMT